MRIRILSDAEDDLIEGFYFYEDRLIGLGYSFLEHMDAEILHFSGVSETHSKHFGYYRMIVRKRFPYAIYYNVTGDEILIHAVFDCRMDPREIEARVTDR